MLCISMKTGEYFTVNGDTVIQYDRLYGDRVHLCIHAPREIPIVRGAALERNGGKRPSCVLDLPEPYVRQLPWNGAKKRALAELRRTLERMDDGPDVRILREKLDYIFPKPQEEAV